MIFFIYHLDSKSGKDNSNRLQQVHMILYLRHGASNLHLARNSQPVPCQIRKTAPSGQQHFLCSWTSTYSKQHVISNTTNTSTTTTHQYQQQLPTHQQHQHINTSHHQQQHQQHINSKKHQHINIISNTTNTSTATHQQHPHRHQQPYQHINKI